MSLRCARARRWRPPFPLSATRRGARGRGSARDGRRNRSVGEGGAHGGAAPPPGEGGRASSPQGGGGGRLAAQHAAPGAGGGDEACGREGREARKPLLNSRLRF